MAPAPAPGAADVLRLCEELLAAPVARVNNVVPLLRALRGGGGTEVSRPSQRSLGRAAACGGAVHASKFLCSHSPQAQGALIIRAVWLFFEHAEREHGFSSAEVRRCLRSWWYECVEWRKPLPDDLMI